MTKVNKSVKNKIIDYLKKNGCSENNIIKIGRMCHLTNSDVIDIVTNSGYSIANVKGKIVLMSQDELRKPLHNHSIITDDIKKEMRKLREDGCTVYEIAKKFGVNRKTVSRYTKDVFDTPVESKGMNITIKEVKEEKTNIKKEYKRIIEVINKDIKEQERKLETMKEIKKNLIRLCTDI